MTMTMAGGVGGGTRNLEHIYKCACSDYLYMLCLHMHRLLCAVQVITDVFVAFGTAKIVDEDLFEVELVWRLT